MKNPRFWHIMLLLMLIAVPAVSQAPLQGKYAYYRGDYSGSYGITIAFLPNAGFTYYAFQCMSHQTGQGKYVFEHGHLVLKFTRTDTVENTVHIVPVRSPNGKIQYCLHVEHMDMAGQKKQESEMVVLTLRNGKDEKAIMDATDEHGDYCYETQGAADSVTVEVLPGGNYKPARFVTRLTGGFRSEIMLAPGCYDCTDIQELSYIVLKATKHELVLGTAGKQFLFKKEVADTAR